MKLKALAVVPILLMLLSWAVPAQISALDNPTNFNKSASFKSRSEILKISNEIDRLVDIQLSANEIARNPLASDEVFVRRVYLDIIGRIPNLDEVKEFLDSDSVFKREELIDELLDSYGFVSHQYNFWADILRLKSRLRNVQGQPYIDYVKDSLEQNKPYDVFVREMLSSSGPLLAEGNGQVGYYLRDVGMPEDNMSNTIRVFLGTRLECAQCHDHPFDKWTQRQYFEMVAFTGGMSYNVAGGNLQGKLRQATRKKGIELSQNHRRVARQIIQPLTMGVSGTGTGLAVLPEGFMGDDGEEGEIIKAKTMFEGESLVDSEIPTFKDRRGRQRRPKKIRQQRIPGAREVNSREIYAEWLTDAENPRFATVIANRLWKQALGMGLVEPVDIFDDGTEASNPELMRYLTATMIDLEFDMKQYLRAIYNSRTYQSAAVRSDIPDPAKFNFEGPVVRRLSAEQLWDSLLTLAVEELDERYEPKRFRLSSYFGTDSIYESIRKLQRMSSEELYDVIDDIVKQGGVRKVQDAMKSQERKDRNRVNAQVKKISQQLSKAKRARDNERVKELLVRRAELVAKYKKKRSGNGFRRASEIQSPAPAGHFLREFGQSDRDQIENANTDPAVTQVLSLMNGFVESQISSNPNTVLVSNIVKPETVEEKVEAVYLSMLARKPKAGEMAIWKRDFEKNKFNAVSDLIWVLANSNEFIFVK